VLYIQTDVDEPTWAPLEKLRELAGERTDIDPPDVEAYMYMGAVVDEDRIVTIHLYKHQLTRRYLNVDDAGHAYVYAGSADEHFRRVFYDQLHDLAAAVDWAQGEIEWVSGERFLHLGDDAA
jgi:hypothetical protein